MYLSVNSFNFSFSAKSKKEKKIHENRLFLASEEVINTAYICRRCVFRQILLLSLHISNYILIYFIIRARLGLGFFLFVCLFVCLGFVFVF
ncbi:rCG33470 [Rattus norvegicus]|uniref:RCG33470 n=1 Tax=Rattus norvegicus TaxID=10116 RepID=A6HGY9_RAT|nr:rCG33470 [Rattus norvegicus]